MIVDGGRFGNTNTGALAVAAIRVLFVVGTAGTAINVVGAAGTLTYKGPLPAASGRQRRWPRWGTAPLVLLRKLQSRLLGNLGQLAIGRGDLDKDGRGDLVGVTGNGPQFAVSVAYGRTGLALAAQDRTLTVPGPNQYTVLLPNGVPLTSGQKADLRTWLLDFDGDNGSDLFYMARDASGLVAGVARFNGTGFDTAVPIAADSTAGLHDYTQYTAAVVGDVNLDGYDDLVFGNPVVQGGGRACWRSTGPSSTTGSPPWATGRSATG